jgi:hypothetical protein
MNYKRTVRKGVRESSNNLIQRVCEEFVNIHSRENRKRRFMDPHLKKKRAFIYNYVFILHDELI